MNDNPLTPLPEEMADAVTTYANLPPEAKKHAEMADRWTRGAVASFVEFADSADFKMKEQFYNTEIKPILMLIGNAEKIPNTSGLAGAVDLKVGELTMLLTMLFDLQKEIDDHLELIVKAIGINANR